MNYTEKYHLPQWDETDRVLRTDFNSAMAEIEKGLDGGSASNGETRTQAWNRLCRLAYNHYCMVQKMTPVPWQIGLFQQDPAKNQEGIGGTEAYWEGVRFAGKAETPLTNEILSNCLHTLTEMKVYKNQPAKCVSMTMDFQPPASGSIRNFIMQGSYSDCTAQNIFSFRLTLTNRDTGVVEKTLNMQMAYFSNAATFTQIFGETIPFIGGVHYLLTFEPISVNCNMTANFGISQDTVATTIASDGILTADHTFQEQEPGTGGMMILRCATYGTGGALTFRWDGVEREPDISRKTLTSDGKTVQELIYLRDDVVPQDSKLSLRFDSNVGGSFLFYDWGAMLF